jgi:hypothetical protein
VKQGIKALQTAFLSLAHRSMSPKKFAPLTDHSAHKMQ